MSSSFSLLNREAGGLSSLGIDRICLEELTGKQTLFGLGPMETIFNNKHKADKTYKESPPLS
jgi:hypothetical protein